MSLRTYVCLEYFPRSTNLDVSFHALHEALLDCHRTRRPTSPLRLKCVTLLAVRLIRVGCIEERVVHRFARADFRWLGLVDWRSVAEQNALPVDFLRDEFLADKLQLFLGCLLTEVIPRPVLHKRCYVDDLFA